MRAPVTIRAEAPLSDFSISPSGAELVGSLGDGRIRVWSVAGELLRSFPAGDPPSPFLMHLGNRRLVAGGPAHAEVLDLTSGRRLASWKIPELVNAASAADGSLAAGAAADGRILLWKPDGTLSRTLTAPALVEIAGIAVSPRGDRVAACGTDADVRVFDIRTGALERVLDLTMAAFALAFSPRGGTLAAGCADGQVVLWDVASGRLASTLGRHALGVGAVAFSPDGGRLASAGVSRNPVTAEAEARVCEVVSGKETATPLGISRWNRVGFAPDGRAFAALIQAETVTVRDLSS